MVLRCFAALAGLVLAVTAAGPARRQDGVTPTSVLIGQSAAFTGPAAQLGIQMRAGAKLWIDSRQRPGRHQWPHDRAEEPRRQVRGDARGGEHASS